MKCLERNKRTFYYALYQGKEDVIDEDGNKTGEKIDKYGNPVVMRANVSPPHGETAAGLPGNMIDYDRIILTEDMNCPINEYSRLWIDRLPVIDTNTGETETPHDYTVKRVSPSINVVLMAIDRVEVS